jgi:GDPmannose 4,6-dehydratase
MADRRALITGVGGQDGSYLAELLVGHGVDVIGIDKVGSNGGLLADTRILDRVRLVACTIDDPNALGDVLRTFDVTEVHHLAGATFVPDSWSHPAATAHGVLAGASVLEAVGSVNPAIRVVLAASAEVFGSPDRSPQDEATPIRPSTPYGAVKAFGLFLGRMYRERHGLHVSSAILFNHESPRRAPHFVSRKITRAAAAISLGLESSVVLGDTGAVRDWSDARDIVRALDLMARSDTPDDYILASGVARSVEDMLEVAFGHVGLDWREHVEVDQELVRPRETHPMCGDISKARRSLGWQPAIGFDETIREMVDADLALLRGGA